jgi:gliding motility-associated-like protein
MQSRIFQALSLLLLLFIISVNQANATHVRAGEIIAIRDTTGGNSGTFRYRFIFTMYRDTCPTCVAAGPATLYFGYGSPPENSGSVEPNSPRVLIGNDTERVTYEFTHTYPAAGIYQVYVTVDNRNRDVLNMVNSVNTSFHVETTIFINQQVGINNTPVLRIPPVDLARVGQRYVHNPDAFDIDGDSLSYRIVTPKQAFQLEVNGYRDPQLVQAGTNEAGTGPATFSITQKGDLIWDAPTRPGIYNVAFVVEEWRNGEKIGIVTRDMQIIVRDHINLRPLLEIPNDTCIVAGSPLPGFVRATDPDGNRIRLSASSGLFQSNFPAPRASFTVPAPIQNNPATGNFFWQTQCLHVREQPYQVVFRAEDLPTPDTSRKLVDIRTWQIRVVGPKPTGLTATAQGNSIELSWDAYTCSNASQMVIWRRIGCGDLPDDPCRTGVDPASGYVQIGTVPIGTTTFVDDNQGEGLESGVSYSYVISASFAPPSGGESLASDAVCASLALDVPFITNVSVEATDPLAGEIFVRWLQPRELNVAAFPGPYRYEVYRANGLAGSDFSLVGSRTITSFAAATVNDTTFRDQGLNTQDSAYNYMILFYYQTGRLKDSSATASSVRLSVTPGVNVIDLSWQANVPWSNAGTTHKVYRESRTLPGVFELLAEVAVGDASSFRFSDTGNGLVLDEDSTYCYYVETYGSYGNPKILSPLINKSQIACAAPLDTLAPCPPLLAIDSLDCSSLTGESFCNVTSFANKLTWSYPAAGGENCDEDIVAYRLYYKRYEEDTEFGLIATINSPQPPAMFYEHGGLSSYAGCYYVTAVDEDGQESAPSNVVCKDNCPYYELPNVFTPNGDSKNDVFTPFPCPRFVESVEVTVYNRWGRPMFETSNVLINWDGLIGSGEEIGGSEVTNGVYYYLAKVRFARLRRSDELTQIKGWVQILR